MTKLTIAFRMILERFGLLLLRLAGTAVQIYPAHMELYREEITELCRRERETVLSTDDVLGIGYFRGRRVMSIMKKKYPQLAVRDLWKAVDLCSGSISSGPKPQEAPSPED